MKDLAPRIGSGNDASQGVRRARRTAVAYQTQVDLQDASR